MIWLHSRQTRIVLAFAILFLLAPARLFAQRTTEGQMTVIRSRYWYPQLGDTLEQVDYLANNRVRVDVANGSSHEATMFADLDSGVVTEIIRGTNERQVVPLLTLPELADTTVLTATGVRKKLLGIELEEFTAKLDDGQTLSLWVTRALPKDLTRLMATRMSMNSKLDDPRFQTAAALGRIGAAVIRMEQRKDGEINFFREITSIREEPLIAKLLLPPQ